jgi:beta-lactamase superfamily II metal-dependent hydrolase
VDCNRAPSFGGIDLAKLLPAILPTIRVDGRNRSRLNVFVNTHPHKDHLSGLSEIREVTDISEVWHSGHKPGPENDGAFQELASLIASVKKKGGNEVQLLGSRESRTIGLAEVHVLSPAEYIVEEIKDEKPKDRYKRIHDQCSVLRFGYGNAQKMTRIIITGDADKAAWERITGYHGSNEDNRIKAQILSAPHHGSNTTFRDHDDDPPFTGHLAAIAPERVIISAPDKKDSPHGHPDDFALTQYELAVGKENVHHMGSRKWSLIVDVRSDGNYEVFWDRGVIAKNFGFSDSGSDGAKAALAPAIISRVEESRPMG